MIMAFPYLRLDDIDSTWEELNCEIDLDNELDNKKFDQFREYLDRTWMSETAIFSRDLWNFIDDESTHTNNISEAYNHKINNKVMSSNTNIYKILDIVHQEETLAKNSFERANLL